MPGAYIHPLYTCRLNLNNNTLYILRTKEFSHECEAEDVRVLLLRGKRLLSLFFDRTGCFRQPLNFASAASVCNGLKQFFFGAFSIFESGGITKHLMTGPSRNSEFCFPSTSMFPSASPRGTLSLSGNQNSLFPLWPVIKCLLLFIQNIFSFLIG